MLAVHQTGPHGPPPLVMIHGFLGAGLLFAPVLNTLAREHNIITVDLPGCGHSNHLPTGEITAMATAVGETLASLGCRYYHLLGHSMGGMVALALALQAPEQTASMIIYASNHSGHLPDRFETFATSKRRLREDFAATKQAISATWLCDGVAHPHFDLLTQCAAAVSLPNAEQAIDAMAKFDVRARLHELTMPIFIISAEKDRTYSRASQHQLQQSLPHAKWHMMKNCAHCAHLENEEEFNQLIINWLAHNTA